MSPTVVTATITAPTSSYYQRPGMSGRAVRVIDHDSDHGFCSVCGAVWPCARARRDQRRTGTTAMEW